MFNDRSSTKLILYTYFGAAHPMPAGTSIKVGDTVVLFLGHFEVEVEITAELARGSYSGIIEEIDEISSGKNSAFPKLEDVGLKVGESIEFVEGKIHRCTRQCI